MKVIFRYILLIFACFLTANTWSQLSQSIELNKKLSEYTIKDSSRVNLLVLATEEYQNINPDTALMYLTEAYEIAKDIGFSKGIADYYTQMAMYYYIASDLNMVLECSNKSLLINQSINNLKGQAKNLYYIGKINYFQGNIAEATEFINKALEINKSLNDSVSICYNYASLGTNYDDIGDYERAIQYEKKALEIATKINDEKAISFTLNNLGVVYEHHGDLPKALECYQKSLILDERHKNYKDASVAASNIAAIHIVEGDYNDAIQNCLLGLKYAEKIGFKTGLTYNYEYLGRTYMAMGDYSKAWEYQNKTLSLQKEIGNKQGEVIAYRDLANILVAKGELSKAMEYYQTTIKFSQAISYVRTEISSYIGLSNIYFQKENYNAAYKNSNKAYTMAFKANDIKLISESAQIMAQICEAQGKYKEAYNAHVTFKNMSDSLFNEANIRRISNLEYEYKATKEKELRQLEQDEKDRIQLAELNKQKAVRNSLIVGFIFVLLLALIIWRSSIERRIANKKLRAKNLEIENQSKELKKTNSSLKQLSRFKEDMTNMVIHDLKNPLSTLINVDILSELDEKDELIKHLSLRMLNMVENTLDIYKNESVELIMHKEENDLRTIINNAIEEIEFLAKINKQSFNIQIESPISVNADAMVLRRVFSNLLSNAVKFSSKNEVISIKADVSSNHILTASVNNKGSFISSDEQKHIFNRFTQIEAHSNTQIHSTGLGLTYCSMAIEAHGGRIGVESHETDGTTFWFTLPEANITSNG